jgi:hypothetical protein
MGGPPDLLERIPLEYRLATAIGRRYGHGDGRAGAETRMSIAVPLERLRSAVEERAGAAYLLTVGESGRPHVVHVPVRWEGDALVAAQIGKRSAANAVARPGVSLLYPVRNADDHSLIVDGSAAIVPLEDGRELRITPTSAMLHRQRAVPDPAASCEGDCVPLLSSTKRGEK